MLPGAGCPGGVELGSYGLETTAGSWLGAFISFDFAMQLCLGQTGLTRTTLPRA